MSKVLTFSRFFPAYHPRVGQLTGFVEKIWRGFKDETYGLPKEWHSYIRDYTKAVDDRSAIDLLSYYLSVEPKYHTIRAGHRWRVGDKFSPRVWSGKPYRSKQAVIGPDIEVKRAWNIEIKANDKIIIDHCDFGTFCEVNPDVMVLAKNDGLSTVDLLNWFPNNKDFEGQIICWNENIEY